MPETDVAEGCMTLAGRQDTPCSGSQSFYVKDWRTRTGLVNEVPSEMVGLRQCTGINSLDAEC